MRSCEPGGALRRARALLLIPIAAFAIAAIAPPSSAVAATSTSEPGAPETHVATDGSQVFVAWGSPASTADWAASSDGYTFAWVDRNSVPEEVAEACVPSDPNVCYRAIADLLSIQVTRDGGETWIAEWSDPDRRHSYWFQRKDRGFVPIAVLETNGTYRVFVATGGNENFAVRAPDGTWGYVDERGGASDGVLSPPRVSAGDARNIPRSIGSGFGAFMVALLVIGMMARDRGAGWRVLRALALIPLALAEFLSVSMLVASTPELDASWSRVGDEFGSVPLVALLFIGMIVVLLLMMLGFSIAVPTSDRDVPAILGWAAFVGLATGLARLVPLPLYLPLWARIPLVVAVAGAALAVAVIRGPRWRARSWAPLGVEK